MNNLTEKLVWRELDKVMDPEIPVVSLVEMGIIRRVQVVDEGVTVTMTPTFSGCPAWQVMKEEVTAILKELGAVQVDIVVELSPAWTSDWITPHARKKLTAFGLAPPHVHGGNFTLEALDVVSCPYCDSKNTVLKNSFGPTLCRAIYYCNNCKQPFEQFKPL